jgi:hypothetical protein
MERKYRLILYLSVGLIIPILIYIIYPQDWRQTLPWLGIVAVLGIVTEVVYHYQGKK